MPLWIQAGARLRSGGIAKTNPATTTVTHTVPAAASGNADGPSNYYGPGTAHHARLDSDAKSNARIMVSYVETCFTNTQDYTQCRTADQLAQAVAALRGPAIQAGVSMATRTTYVIAAHSLSGNTFVISKKPDGAIERTCVTPGKGGCLATGIW